MMEHYHLLIRTRRANLSRSMQWLGATYTKLIMSQFLNVADKHIAYREGAQKYSKEEQRNWEDLRNGIFIGTKKFVQRIKKRYLPNIPDGEIPHQRKLSKSIDPEAVLTQAAEILKCKLERFQKTARVSQADKLNRDMLIYLMWQTGSQTNLQIAEKFGLTYSAVSQRVGVFKNMLSKSTTLQNEINRVKSLIKL